MYIAMEKKTVLRPRRKTSYSITPVKRSPPKSETHVTKITLSVSRENKTTKHEIYFDEEPLTLREMYEDGFLGDLEFLNDDGSVRPAELVAGPKGEFDGDVVSHFVFLIRDPETKEPMDAHVRQFNFSTRN